MKSTDHRPARGRNESVDPFDRLRAAYYARLRTDWEQLAALREQLKGSPANPRPVHESIRMLAHRMCGAAAIFEAPAVLDAAATLEQATLAALDAGTSATRERVCSSLDAVMTILASLHGS